MISRMQFCLAAGFLASCVLAGCGSASPNVPMSGKVTFDGKPLEKGLIEFYPVAPTLGGVAGSPIEKGAYSIPAENGLLFNGKYIVRITATRKSGKQAANILTGTGQMDLFEQYLPASYNSASKLELIISDRNKRTADFNLTADGK